MLAIFLDTETTGLDPTKHSPIDVAIKIVNVSSMEEKASYQSIVKQPSEVWDRKDPISVEINGYTWEEVQKGKEPSVVAEEVMQLFKECGVARDNAVFICQNPSFDRGFFTQIIDVYTQERLHWPYHWLDLASMYWVMFVKNRLREGNSFPEEMILSKNFISQAYGLPIEEQPHHAMGGVDHLIQCYKAVVGVNFKELE